MENPMHGKKDVGKGDSWAPNTPIKTYRRKRFNKDKPKDVSLCVVSLENNNEAKREEFCGHGYESKDFGVSKEDCFGLDTNDVVLMPSDLIPMSPCQAGRVFGNFTSYEDLNTKVVLMNCEAHEVAKNIETCQESKLDTNFASYEDLNGVLMTSETDLEKKSNFESFIPISSIIETHQAESKLDTNFASCEDLNGVLMTSEADLEKKSNFKSFIPISSVIETHQESKLDTNFTSYEDLNKVLMTFEADLEKKSDFESFIPISSVIETHQGHEQSEDKKKEDINAVSSNVNSATSLTPTTGLETNSKKRKKDCIDLNKTPRKTPRKKVHMPKILGEGRQKRPSPTQPKTPKPSTPKPVYVKKSVSVNRKNKSSLNNSVSISKQVGVVERVEADLSCKRSLNFDKELPLQVQSSIAQVDEANASLTESIVSLNALSETLTMSVGFPSTCKKKRATRRRKKLDDMPGPSLVVKTKKKRSRLRTPRKDLSIFGQSLPHENLKIAPHGEDLAHEKQESVICPMLEAKTDALSTGRAEFGPSSLELEFDNGKREDGPSENLDLRSDYKPIDVAEEKVAMKPMLPDLNLPNGKNEICLPEHEYVLFATQSSGKGLLANVPQHEHGAQAPLLEKDRNEKLDASLTEMPGQGQLAVVKKNKLKLMCEIYAKQIHEWRLKVKAICNGIEDNADNEAKEKLENERAVFRGRIEYFTACMHVFLGNRNYSQWKGSVLDSVIGVFLTQNVSDILSSSAFMILKAKFPVQSSSTNHENLNIFDNQELVESCTKISEPTDELVGMKLFADKEEHIGDVKDIGLKTQETPSEFPHFNSCLATECSLEENVKMVDRDDIDKLKTSFDGLLSGLQETSGGKSSNSKEQHSSEKKNTSKKREEKDKEVEIDWEEVRKKYFRSRERPDEHKDSVDWEAVRCAPVKEIAEAIKNRGQHNNIADRIQEFLNRVVKLHKTLDLEWLRDTPPDLVKKYLLEFNGLGLKSVECIRLLALQNVAFPVDTNVGRVAVRLGWVPLEPLPEELQLHLLQKYPIMDSIQKYLWPRLSTLNPLELYELHYHLITFGKVFCTKKNPKCDTCPLKKECRHYASEYASARRSLPEPRRKKKSSSSPSGVAIHPPHLLEDNQYAESSQYRPNMCVPIIEEPSSPKLPQCRTQIWEPMIVEPSTPELSQCRTIIYEPIIEEPSSPEPEHIEPLEIDIEDFFSDDDPDKIQTIIISKRQSEATTALVPLAPEVAAYPMPKLKQVSRLRTKHLVYVLPDDNPLLTELDKRDDKDPSPYLLLIWPTDESCSSQECGNDNSSANDGTIRGTILIPSRTAMKGSFPLNGTYFQVNEVFADHETSHHPINVPRELLWNLQRRTVYFGTSTSAIFGGVTTQEIGYCFWKGYMCVRAFERKTGLPKPLSDRLHISTTQQAAIRKKRGKKKDE